MENNSYTKMFIKCNNETKIHRLLSTQVLGVIKSYFLRRRRQHLIVIQADSLSIGQRTVIKRVHRQRGKEVNK